MSLLQFLIECKDFIFSIIYEILHFLSFGSNLSCIFLITTIIFLILFLKQRKKFEHFEFINTENCEEFLIIDHQFNILKKSDKFYNFLNFENNSNIQVNSQSKNLPNILETFQSKMPVFFNLLQTAIVNKKSFFYKLEDRPINIIVNYYKDKISLHLELNLWKILDSLPIPILINLDFLTIKNKCFSIFGNLQSTEFLFKGQFFTKHNNIFKKEIITIDNGNLHILFPIVKYDEYLAVSSKFYTLPPIPICVLNKNGEITKQSEEFGKLFNLEQNLNTFQDFLETIRSYILHEQIFFSDLKKYFLNLISKLDSYHEEMYHTVDGKVILFKFIPQDENIFLILENITQLSINKTQEYLFKDLTTKLIPELSDFIILTDADGIVTHSNLELVAIGEKISTVKTILKMFTTSDSSVQEIRLSNNGKCLLLKISIKEKIFKVKNYIITYLDKIIKILYLLNNTLDDSLGEYLKYIKFILINIENSIKTLEVGINKNYQCTNFDLVHEFNEINSELEKSVTFKNLNIIIPSKTLDVYSSKDSIVILMENILLIAFKYQFNNKNLIIEEKNGKVYVTLEGINKEEIDRVYTIFNLISNIHIFSNIKEVGDSISVGFYFDKIADLTN